MKKHTTYTLKHRYNYTYIYDHAYIYNFIQTAHIHININLQLYKYKHACLHVSLVSNCTYILIFTFDILTFMF